MTRPLALLALLPSLAACAAFAPRYNERPRHWEAQRFPVPILADTRCERELQRAAEYWEVSATEYAGRPVALFATHRAAVYDAQPPRGEIWLVDGAMPAPDVLGTTETWTYLARRETLWSALVTLDESRPCDWVVVAHELGHALGLGHNAEGCLMYYQRARNSQRIHDDELELVMRAYRGEAL